MLRGNTYYLYTRGDNIPCIGAFHNICPPMTNHPNNTYLVLCFEKDRLSVAVKHVLQ
jgi:hypothetical protein